MPISSQALYFHLGMRADDDGIVEAFTTIRMTGCTEDDLRVLVAKGFVQVLNEDLITYITDWTENNKIRADRKMDSIYKDLLLKINPVLTDKCQTDDGQMTDICLTNDSQVTPKCQHRLGKDRLGKDRTGKDRLGEDLCSESQGAFEPEADVALIPLNDGSAWRPLLSDYEEWCRIYPNVDIAREIERMRQWSIGNPTKRKTRRGVRRFVTNWLDREQNKVKRQQAVTGADAYYQMAEEAMNGIN